MSSTHNSTTSIITKGAIAGLIAGMVLAMWAMTVGAFTQDSTFWAPPQGIAQAVGIGEPGHQFQALPLIVGLMAHMMNSAILGAVFALIAVRLSASAKVLAGMVFGLGVWVVMDRIVLRGILSDNADPFLSANPTWSWLVAHLMFGLALGGLLAFGPLALVGRAGGRQVTAAAVN